MNISLSLENPCISLLVKENTWKCIFNTNSELSQICTEKQITPFKTIVNWLFNDIWCYLVIGYFDWKIVVFQQTVVRVYYIFDEGTEIPDDSWKCFSRHLNNSMRVKNVLYWVLVLYSAAIHYVVLLHLVSPKHLDIWSPKLNPNDLLVTGGGWFITPTLANISSPIYSSLIWSEIYNLILNLILIDLDFKFWG